MCRVHFGHPGVNEVGVSHTPSRTWKTRGGAAWLRPLDAFVRIADSLVAADVGHGLVQARSADAHEGQADDLMVNPAHGGALRC